MHGAWIMFFPRGWLQKWKRHEPNPIFWNLNPASIRTLNTSPDDKVPEMTSARMSAVLLKGHGGYEQLEYRDDVSVPEAKPGEVLIAVGAAGINNTDINTRIGWYSKSVSSDTAATNGAEDVEEDGSWGGAPLSFPRIQGTDVCGHIVGVGEGVSSDRIGQRVLIEPCLRKPDQDGALVADYFGSECNGGFAQYTTVDSRFAHTIESTMTDVELASFPCSYGTAENMLFRAKLDDGETVLITGASGGVGSAAIQLAKRRGANVIAVSGAAKADEVKSLGADVVVDRNDDLLEVLGADRVHVVVDLVAGPAWPRLLDVMKPGGRYTVAGAIAGPMVELDVRTLYLKDLNFFGCTVLEHGVFANLVSYIEKGEIKPLVARSYPLKDIVEAQKDFLEKRHTGKLVLEIGSGS